MVKLLMIEEHVKESSCFEEVKNALVVSPPPTFRLVRSSLCAADVEQVAAESVGAILLAIEHVDSRSLRYATRLCARFQELPIFVLARADRHAAAERVLRAGAQDYLVMDELEPRLLHRALMYGVERKKMDIALLSAEAKFSKAVRASLDAVAITTESEGRFLEFNEGFVRLLGHRHDEALGKTTNDLGIWVDPEGRSKLLERLRDHGRVHECEMPFRTKSGELRECLFSAELVIFGGVNCILTIARDITESKRLQQKSKQSHSGETLGRLAGGLVHDLNNWLTVMLGHCELVLAKMSPADPMRTNIIQIKSAVGSAESLAAQLLALGRERDKAPQFIDLNLAVARIAKMLRRVLNENIDLVVRVDAFPKLVKVFPGQMEQALLNLALNARDAMPNGGKLTVETSGLTVSDQNAMLHPGVAPGDYVILTVSDTGTGMDAETLGHVFDPFFTTKLPGGGTGLGLCTVQDFVRHSGGFIRVQSEPGRGASFRLGFPASRWGAHSPEPIAAGTRSSD
jgi:two-component system cell cycle sensor histidine kinase/response regulator CckA